MKILRRLAIPLVIAFLLGGGVEMRHLVAQTISPSPPNPNPLATYLSPMTVGFSATAATATFTTPYVQWSGKDYDIFALYAGITGSPATCILTPKVSADGKNFVSQSTISISPATGITLPANATAIVGQYFEMTFSCATYPTAGTLQISVTTHQS
jgi:hypothetical protein